MIIFRGKVYMQIGITNKIIKCGREIIFKYSISFEKQEVFSFYYKLFMNNKKCNTWTLKKLFWETSGSNKNWSNIFSFEILYYLFIFLLEWNCSLLLMFLYRFLRMCNDISSTSNIAIILISGNVFLESYFHFQILYTVFRINYYRCML